jgi:thiol-disulfide isomerase/thioredoxin
LDNSDRSNLKEFRIFEYKQTSGGILGRLVFITVVLILSGVIFSQEPVDPLCIGCEAPTFSLPSLEQDYVSLRDFCGQTLRKPWINKIKHVVVISFFATWCEPCKKEIPHLTKLMDEFKDQPVKFFLIDVGEEREKVINFVNSAGIEIPVLLDRYQKTTERFNALTLPRLFVLDKNGLIQRKQKGFTNPQDFEIEMRELLTFLLEEN